MWQEDPWEGRNEEECPMCLQHNILPLLTVGDIKWAYFLRVECWPVQKRAGGRSIEQSPFPRLFWSSVDSLACPQAERISRKQEELVLLTAYPTNLRSNHNMMSIAVLCTFGHCDTPNVPRNLPMISNMKLLKAPVISFATSMKGIYLSDSKLDRISCHHPKDLGVKEKQGRSISWAVTEILVIFCIRGGYTTGL